MLFSAEAIGATGILEIRSEPSGGKIYLDGSYVGETPYMNPEIPTGKHSIRINFSNDYPDQTWDVTIDSITPQTRTFIFGVGPNGKFTGVEKQVQVEKRTGNVQFASIPSGAELSIDGERKKVRQSDSRMCQLVNTQHGLNLTVRF